jgi:hypothetical protein
MKKENQIQNTCSFVLPNENSHKTEQPTCQDAFTALRAWWCTTAAALVNPNAKRGISMRQAVRKILASHYGAISVSDITMIAVHMQMLTWRKNSDANYYVWSIDDIEKELARPCYGLSTHTSDRCYMLA